MLFSFFLLKSVDYRLAITWRRSHKTKVVCPFPRKNKLYGVVPYRQCKNPFASPWQHFSYVSHSPLALPINQPTSYPSTKSMYVLTDLCFNLLTASDLRVNLLIEHHSLLRETSGMAGGQITALSYFRDYLPCDRRSRHEKSARAWAPSSEVAPCLR